MRTDHPDRKSPRAQWHDYNCGLYFVTFCTKNREHYFGTVANGKMQLTEIGQYADLQLQNVTTHYPYAKIPVWVVMPNHIHAIVGIHVCRDAARHVPTKGKRDTKMQIIAVHQGWLSVCMGGIKSASTRYANENNIPFAWQLRFYDHIIRNEHELECINQYIRCNPANWKTDRFC